MTEGCAFLLEAGESCGADVERPRRSAYCDRHYAICHLAAGSAAERHDLDDIERMAKQVGGRRATARRIGPSLGFLSNLTKLLRRS